MLLDSNEWLASNLLRSPSGAALLYQLERLSFQLLLPEVVELEVQAQVVRSLTESAGAIRSASRSIQGLIGSVDEFEYPGADKITGCVRDRFARLEERLRRAPLTADATRRAVGRAIARQPPCRSGEQLRDALLWEAAMEAVGPGASIVFVTGDGAFFESNERAQLARALEDDAKARGIGVTPYRRVQAFLASVSPSRPIDPELEKAVVESVRKGFESGAFGPRFTPADATEQTVEAFVVASPENAIGLSFLINFAVPLGQLEVDGEAWSGSVVVRGSVYYDYRKRVFANLQPDEIQFTSDIAGSPRPPGKKIIRVGSLVLGRRQIPQEFRVPLSEAGRAPRD